MSVQYSLAMNPVMQTGMMQLSTDIPTHVARGQNHSWMARQISDYRHLTEDICFGLNSRNDLFTYKNSVAAPRKITKGLIRPGTAVRASNPRIGRLSKRREFIGGLHATENPRAIRRRGNRLDHQKTELSRGALPIKTAAWHRLFDIILILANRGRTHR
jgi:hypothetical protein